MALALATLEIASKEASDRGWLPRGRRAAAVPSSSGAGFARRSLTAPTRRRTPHLPDPAFAVGSWLSFRAGHRVVCSVYMMPVFLAFVRDYEALEIGEIMLVTGVAQLASTAPMRCARTPDRCADTDRRGLSVFALGLAMSAFQTPQTDYVRCSGPRLFAAWRSCSVCCRRREWRSDISLTPRCRTRAACST